MNNGMLKSESSYATHLKGNTFLSAYFRKIMKYDNSSNGIKIGEFLSEN